MTKLLAKQIECERLLHNTLALQKVKLNEVLESNIKYRNEVLDVESFRRVSKWHKKTKKSKCEVNSLRSEKSTLCNDICQEKINHKSKSCTIGCIDSVMKKL